MLGKIWQAFTGTSSEPSSSAADNILREKGFSLEYAEARAPEIRRFLIDFRSHRNVIIEHVSSEEAAPLSASVDRASIAIEKVVQMLGEDPNDFRNVGLSLEALSPLNRLLEQAAQAAATGASSSQRKAALSAAVEALTHTAEKFEGHAKGSLGLDNAIKIEALKGTVNDLTK